MAYFGHVLLYSDGGSKGNPGAGAVGVVLCDSANKVLYEFSECIGDCTNNQAEYKALIRGLDLCARYTRKKVTCFADSELLVKQMNGQYRLKNDELGKLHHDVLDRTRIFEEVVFQHVPRTNQMIARADQLVGQAQTARPVDKCIVSP